MGTILEEAMMTAECVTRDWNIVIPTYHSQLNINDGVVFKFVRSMPSLWHRFWYRVLLGWKWEELNSVQDY